ncbi:hypothetical protein CPB85DRAFT_1255618 [Mucidula mucida]|nr:hypothetical protein CPB85DRAFT_1255618 [Mucidula mucida]
MARKSAYVKVSSASPLLVRLSASRNENPTILRTPRVKTPPHKPQQVIITLLIATYLGGRISSQKRKKRSTQVCHVHKGGDVVQAMQVATTYPSTVPPNEGVTGLQQSNRSKPVLLGGTQPPVSVGEQSNPKRCSCQTGVCHSIHSEPETAHPRQVQVHHYSKGGGITPDAMYTMWHIRLRYWNS